MMNKIDIALLSSKSTYSEVEKACLRAIASGYNAVCIPPYFVKAAVEILSNEKVKVSTVIGYPMGYSATPAKVEEIKRALDDEVDELSAVVNSCAILNGNWKYVKNDISSMTNAVHLKGKKIAMVIDASILSKDELLETCAICIENEVNAIQITLSDAQNEQGFSAFQEIKKMLPSGINLKLSLPTQNFDMASAILEKGADFIVFHV